MRKCASLVVLLGFINTEEHDMKIEINNIELYYHQAGQGDPLILLHGNGEDHHIFDQLSQKLQNHFTVYAIDSRNHGASSKTTDYDYATMVEDLYLFIDALKLQKVNIIGFSDGAIISLMLAITHSNTINKMALLGVNLNPKDFTTESYHFVEKMYKETQDPLFKLMLEQPNLKLEDIKDVIVPTLVIGAEKDIYKPELFTNIARTMPNAKLMIMPEHDHASYIVGQDILYSDLLSFFNPAS